MANTYIQVLLHLVFAVKNRESLLPIHWQSQIHSYMAGIINNRGHRALEVGGIDNHVHILLSYSGKEAISDLVREIKTESNKFIVKHCMFPYKFEWQVGYACFSYSYSHLEAIRSYIRHQHEHHNGISLADEMRTMLEKFGVDYDDKYIMTDPE